jgi:DNA (cytosine-5)-methyltransferase 1
MEFGATYPLGRAPLVLSKKELWKYRGSFGTPLQGKSDEEIAASLPKYALGEEEVFPEWKVRFIRQNRDFYAANRVVIDKWLPSISTFAPSFQKFEWNWKDGPRNIWKTIIQFRSSGIRVKRPQSAPSLVALTTSQVPVIGWEKRYMTFRECARLQSMDKLKYLPESQTGAYRALGNAVNVTVIRHVAERLLSAQA